jgi:hypothetical protein
VDGSLRVVDTPDFARERGAEVSYNSLVDVSYSHAIEPEPRAA